MKTLHPRRRRSATRQTLRRTVSGFLLASCTIWQLACSDAAADDALDDSTQLSDRPSESGDDVSEGTGTSAGDVGSDAPDATTAATGPSHSGEPGTSGANGDSVAPTDSGAPSGPGTPHSSEGSAPDPCLTLDCGASGRTCLQEGETASCGPCLPSREEVDDACRLIRGCTLGEDECLAEVIPLLKANGPIRSAAVGPDGNFYLAGRFTFLIRPEAIRGMARYGEAMQWRSGWPGVHGRVMALAPDGRGGVFLGGDFEDVAGEPRVNLAHVDASGRLGGWAPEVSGWSNVALRASNVERIFVHGDTVHVSGRFSRVRGVDSDEVTQSALVAFDRAGRRHNWAPEFAVPMLGPELRLAATNGMLVVGGRFTAVDGEARTGLAAFDTDGELLDWAPHAVLADGAPAIIHAVATDGGVVHIGGNFAQVNGEVRSTLAAITSGGELLDWTPSVEGVVGAMAVHGDVLYVGGQLSVQGDGRYLRVVGIRLEDAALSGFDVRLGGNLTGEVRDLLPTPAGLVIIGDLTTPGANPREIVRATWAGELDNWTPHADGEIHAIAPVGHDDVVLGGPLEAAESIPRRSVAAVTPEGAVTHFRIDVDDAYADILAWHGNRLLLGGSFASIGGEPRQRLAAVTPEGTLTDWTPAPIRPDPHQRARDVAALAVLGDRIAAAVVGPQGLANYPSLQVFDAETGELAWSAGNAGAFTLLGTDTHVFVAGRFRQFGTIRNHPDFAALSHDGNLLDWAIDYPEGFEIGSPRVTHLAWLDERLFLAGRFTGVNNEPRPGVAALDGQGELTNVGAGLEWSEGGTLAGGDAHVFLGRTQPPDGAPALVALTPDGTPTDFSVPARQVSSLYWLDNRLLAEGVFDLPGGETFEGWVLIAPVLDSQP
ncbi:MAG: hypothetical protein EA398_11100 [Deltaproteobacteria bacterium]|nr:MAG: hypothetical protein EA398_11100 [Deltaproteobacteria bacterium]